MDERKAQLKMLKKAYHRDKRTCVTLWKTLSVVFLVLAVLFGAVAVLLCISDHAATQRLWQFLPRMPALEGYEGFLNIADRAGSLMGLEITMDEYQLCWITVFFLAALGCLVLLLVALPLWGRGVRKLKKTRGYLDYQTMKRAVKELV